MLRSLVLSLVLLVGCKDPEKIDETGTPVPTPADPAPLSNGECPDLSGSGFSSFQSGGMERQVSARIPEKLQEGAPLVLFFHGFDMPQNTDDPGEYLADGLRLQGVADETGAVFLAPEARVYEMYGYEFFMWNVWEEDDLDQVLYDDLRTCAIQDLGVDPAQVHVMGFSGGALFVTTIYRERSDTLASAMEMSGGSDIELSMFENLLSRYDTPANPVPILLYSGGKNDGWPEKMPMVDFREATEEFQDDLLGDGIFTVRCDHDSGHTVTQTEWNIAQEWPFSHVYGQPSPYLENGLGDWDSCIVPVAK